MDKARATRESVFRACDELLLAGQYPSARAVVAITKGSLSTVGPLRDEWWRLLAVNYRDSKYLKGMPPEISEFLTGVWTAASALAKKSFEAEAAKLNESLADRGRELDAAKAAVASTEAELLASLEQARTLASRVEQLTATSARQAQEHSTEVESLRDQLRASLDAAAAQAAEARASAAEAARALAAASESAAEERRRLMLQIDTARQESVRLAEAASSAAERHSTALQALSARLDAALLQVDHLGRDLAAARTEAATAAANLRASEHLVASLRTDRDALADRVSASEAMVASQAELLATQAAASQALNGTLTSLKALIESTRAAESKSPHRHGSKKSTGSI